MQTSRAIGVTGGVKFERFLGPSQDFIESGERYKSCMPNCPICHKLGWAHLDTTPILLMNELTGALKQVPRYAAREYLSKWSLWHELPQSEARKFLVKKDELQQQNYNVPTQTSSSFRIIHENARHEVV
ncbi:hypothetical protein DdX_06146 [Ditylenchus destructor]|uniref:Uncharacterized protein n=1 Tax=Ditylenchus destructor TaxID=166010 RepID=A0AAD4N6Q0_9BILA|nr:hypothetical protein DdX_06146 [Ditylenchus destructor]